MLRDCLPSPLSANPDAGDMCKVLNCPFYLDETTRGLLDQRLPNHVLLTSTRYPPHRIVSSYLHRSNFNLDDLDNRNEFWDSLRTYLREYNPWTLFNYHTKKAINRPCPLTHSDTVMINSVMARYNIVIDVNLPTISNHILRHFNLFTLPNAPRIAQRAAFRLAPPLDVQQLLSSVVCVETEMHFALHFRMASLYEKITGQPCVSNPSCITLLEQQAFNKSNVFLLS